MKRLLLPLLGLAACAAAACAPAAPAAPAERYGFITRLGRDTIAVESVTRRGNSVTIDAVDRFPRVRRRHAEVELAPDGAIRRLVMDIHTPSEPAGQRERRVVADVTADSVHLTKRDRTGTVARAFATDGGVAMAHVPQMYSLYELYLAAALERAAAAGRAAGDTVQMRQFYIDREFDASRCTAASCGCCRTAGRRSGTTGWRAPARRRSTPRTACCATPAPGPRTEWT